MKTRLLLAAVSYLLGTGSATAQAEMQFDPGKLSGWWSESYNTDVTCSFKNLRVKYEFTQGGKRLLLKFDRRWKTELGETDHFKASILSSTERSIVIRYDHETRQRSDGRPIEWEMALVAPGVYRWRETSWPPGEVNTVVGVRCAESG